MNRTLRTFATFVAVVLSSLAPAFAADNTPPEGFRALFNGKDFAGWHGMGHFDPNKLAAMTDAERAEKRAKDMEDLKAHWKVEGGELINDGHGVYLTTDEPLGDIELFVDYKMLPHGDSGIYLCATPQVQIWDYTDPAKFKHRAELGSGGLWNNTAGNPGKDPLVVADKPLGEWNRFRIRQVGARTTVWLNDKLVVDNATLENFWDKTRKSPLLAKGPVQLQTHGSEIRWKNIYVREIPAAEANELLGKPGYEEFKALVHGDSDFATTWKGPVENYECVDGVIRCKPGKGGTVYYPTELTDFVVRVEFKLPPGGNNGLAIRHDGEGNPAFAGMCELQILDDGHEKYAKLDPRQAHGSAYGMVPAYRGYLRPLGEWNYEEVTVKGSTIKVELNGYVILDADLSTVAEGDWMKGHKHPGKDRKSGFFGFAGHGDAVEFRNVRLKQL
ncbi:MAG: DUF1080 domain-containing protein [Pirellulales bacterium]